jgi:ABC-type transporter Mla MlaB component
VMAEHVPASLIGYDPLAWLQETEQQASLSVSEQEIPAIPEQAVSDAPIDTADVGAEAVAIETEVSADDVADWGVQNSGDGAMALPSVVNIQDVGELHLRLQNLLDHHQLIEIDASAVTIIDTASLQLLLVLKLTAAKQQKQVVIDFPSSRFLEAAGLLGLDDLLDVKHSSSGFF